MTWSDQTCNNIKLLLVSIIYYLAQSKYLTWWSSLVTMVTRNLGKAASSKYGYKHCSRQYKHCSRQYKHCSCQYKPHLQTLLTPIQTSHLQTLLMPIQTLLTPIQTLFTPTQTLLTPIQTLLTPIQTLLTPIQTSRTFLARNLLPVLLMPSMATNWKVTSNMGKRLLDCGGCTTQTDPIFLWRWQRGAC